VLGEKSYARLADVPEKIDIVDIFGRSEFLPEIVNSAIEIGAGAICVPEGVIHPKAAAPARKAGLIVIMDSCIRKEYLQRFRVSQR
jgi:uncharacterized protein